MQQFDMAVTPKYVIGGFSHCTHRLNKILVDDESRKGQGMGPSPHRK